jgi:hypothetical protein
VGRAWVIFYIRPVKRVDEAEAKQLFVSYLKKRGESADDWSFGLQPFGDLTWIIHAYRVDVPDPWPYRHIMNTRGDIDELSLGSLHEVFRLEYPSDLQEKDRQEIITQFITLSTGGEYIILNEPSDIPGYDKAKLDPDVAEIVRAPFSFGNLIVVVYTYEQIGGIVSRYRFTFEQGTRFSTVECAVLGTWIGGDAWGYE